MLPDFPQTKRAFWNSLRQRISKFLRVQGNFAMLKAKHVHEGNRTSMRLPGKPVEEQFPFMLAENISIDTQQLIREGPLYIAQLFIKASARAASEQAKMLYQHVEVTSKEAGTALDAGGKPLDFDMFLAMLNRLEIPFDEDGNANLPSLATSSHEIVRRVERWNRDSECLARMEAIIEEKRRAWRDRESNRKLVD